MMEARRSHRATVAGMLIGLGMGGFVDGIVLHQIAPWHHMLSNVVPPHTMDGMGVNMTWDGLFHALTWVITLVGILQLRRRAWRSWGLCRLSELFDLHVRVPALKHRAQFSVERFDTHLQQQMCAAFTPLHLLTLAEAFAHYLVDG